MPQYVVRTDKLEKPHYFAGSFDTGLGHGISLSPHVFGAWQFDTKKEARELIAQIGPDDYTISEVDMSASPSLER